MMIVTMTEMITLRMRSIQAMGMMQRRSKSQPRNQRRGIWLFSMKSVSLSKLKWSRWKWTYRVCRTRRREAQRRNRMRKLEL
jgi:hypothetical protein